MHDPDLFDLPLEGEDPALLPGSDNPVSPLSIGRSRRLIEDLPVPSFRQIQAGSSSFFIVPPWGWRHPIAGANGWAVDPALLAFGQYVKRARYLANLSQQRLEAASGVDQGLISRIERAKAPWARTERLVALSEVLGRNLPLGYCPHEHPCMWQPAPKAPAEPPLDRLTPRMRAVVAEMYEEENASR
jgi:transcriptional regulator with XRE-family HTH domain